jgi:hypothetical protein
LFDRNVQRFKNMIDGGSGDFGGPPPGSIQPPDVEENFEGGDDEVPF